MKDHDKSDYYMDALIVYKNFQPFAPLVAFVHKYALILLLALFLLPVFSYFVFEIKQTMGHIMLACTTSFLLLLSFKIHLDRNKRERFRVQYVQESRDLWGTK